MPNAHLLQDYFFIPLDIFSKIIQNNNRITKVKAEHLPEYKEENRYVGVG